MPDNSAAVGDLLRISIPGPIKVDILGTQTIEFDVPVLQLSGVDSLGPDERSMLQVMTKLISQLNVKQD